VLPSFPSTGVKEVVGAVGAGGAGNGAADYWLIPLLGEGIGRVRDLHVREATRNWGKNGLTCSNPNPHKKRDFLGVAADDLGGERECGNK